MLSPSRIPKRYSDAKINLRISFTSPDLKDARWRSTQEEDESACAVFIFCSWNRAQTGASENLNCSKKFFFLLSALYRTKPIPIIKCLRVKWFTYWQPQSVRKNNDMRCFPCCMHNFAAWCFSSKLRYDFREFNCMICLHAKTRGVFAGLWEFVFLTAHSPLRLFKAMRYSELINSNKLNW